MNNAFCKSIFVSFLLLMSSITHIYAVDNDKINDTALQAASESAAQEVAQKNSAPTQSIIDNSIVDNSAPVAQEAAAQTAAPAQSIVDASAPIQPAADTPTASTADDDRAMQDALAKDLDLITGNKDVQDLFNKTTSQILEAYNEYALEQLQQLDCILEEVATNLTSNALIPTRNRSLALQKIQALRTPLFYIKNTPVFPLKTDAIFAIAKQIQDVADYARMNLEKGLDQCDMYDMSGFNPSTLSGSKDIEEQFKQAFHENAQAIEKLRAKAAHIGLHYYNIAWRWMHKHVFAPWKKYYMTEATLGATWVTTAAFFTWYYFGGTKIPGLPANFGTWLRSKVGWPAQTHDDFILNDSNSAMSATQHIVEEMEKSLKNANWHHSGMSAEEIQKLLTDASSKMQNGHDTTLSEALKRPVGWLGRLEHRIFQLANGKFLVGAMVLAPTGKFLLDTVAPNFINWLTKTTQKVDNFMLGGVYRNKKIDDIIVDSNVTFDDVIGNETAKKVFHNIIEYFKNPEAWERIHIAPKTGILLYGPTRAGKSFMVDAFLGELIKEFGPEAGFKILPIPYSLILDKGIDYILDVARGAAPCIVVIEEIDLLGLQRTENKQMLASFLTAMNSCLQSNSMDKNVIIIGTTNRLENIELALRQPGRFGEHLYFQYPLHDERKIHIERELNKLAVMIEQFDIEHLACLTEGCSYEQISAMIKGALTSAKIDHIAISQNSLEQSLERFVYGIALEPCKIDEQQKRRIATHLAGEIIATQLLDSNLRIATATIRNVRAKIEEQSVYFQYFESTKQNPLEYGKVFYCHDHDVLPLNSKEEQLMQCEIYRAGHMAETLILGSSSNYHAADKQRAYEFALAAVGEGFDVAKLPTAAQNQFFDAAYKQIAQCEADAKKLLEEHKDEVTAIADLLIEKETIGQEEVDGILKKHAIAAA